MNRWSICLSIVGIFLILVSTIQWIFLYPDLSQFLIVSSIGAILIGASYAYSLFRKIEEDIKDLNEGLDLMNIYFRDEIGKLK